MALVSVRNVSEYEDGALYEAVRSQFDALGLRTRIRPDMRVVIKPNLLSARKPDSSATTHPGVVRAIARCLRDLGVQTVLIADSPGGPFVSATLSTVYSVCGYKSLEDVAELNYDTEWDDTANRGETSIQSFHIIKPIGQADFLINVAKLKTHSLTGMSGGIKNLFGCIPGLQKPEMHYRCPEIRSFSEMLLDLSKTVAPDVTFVDAVVGMEGNGPNMGTPKTCGYLLASDNLYAQDYLAAQLIGLDPSGVEMIRLAEERDYFSPSEIETEGDDWTAVPFQKPDTSDDTYLSGLPRFMRGPTGALARRFIKPAPRIRTAKCLGCGKCAESCPEHIIRVENRKARIADRKRCISCFCCQEMCPAHAIEVRRRLIQRKAKS